MRRYPALLRRVIQEGSYTPRLVFNMDGTGRFWKRLPARMLLSLEEKSALGCRAARDLLTLRLGGSAAGDLKLKPLLLYPSENLHALKGCSRPNLPMVWRSHKKAWVTMSILQEWFVHFCPAVERDCARYGLPYKALLILDSAPGHPGNLDDLSDHVRVLHLPKKTMALVQPMNQDIVATFKACYPRTVFRLLALRVGDRDEQLVVLDFWRDYSILDTAYNISESWEEVPPATLNGGWRKLWLEGIQQDANRLHVATLPQILQDILALAHGVGFREVTEADVVELLQSPGRASPLRS